MLLNHVDRAKNFVRASTSINAFLDLQRRTSSMTKGRLVVYPGCSMCQSHPLNLQVIKDLTTRGVDEDWDRNYEEAARLYEESEEYFNHAIEHEIRLERNRHPLRLKCKQYQDRAKRLRLHLEQQRKIKDEKKEN